MNKPINASSDRGDAADGPSETIRRAAASDVLGPRPSQKSRRSNIEFVVLAESIATDDDHAPV